MLDDEESGSQSNFSEKISGQISTKDYNKEPVIENIQGDDESKFCVKYYCLKVDFTYACNLNALTV